MNLSMAVCSTTERPATPPHRRPTYDCKYRLVWITKCRKPVLVGLVAERVGELVRGICKQHDVEILKGRVSKEHAHLFVSVPPHPAISKLVQYLKGKTGPPERFIQNDV